MAKKRMKKGPKIFFLIILGAVLSYIVFDTLEYLITKNIPRIAFEEHEEEYYYNRDFGILNYTSKEDYNKNGVDDQTDILKGAKAYVELNPEYLSDYYAGGYPPETEGVATDLIWYALKNAGYTLKSYISLDIRERYETKDYDVEDIDDQIDFRRIANQITFFEKYAENIDESLNYDNLINYAPGDIVSFDYGEHIAIISDKRDANAIPYILQQSSGTKEEKDSNFLKETNMVITGHYRFTFDDTLESLTYRAKHAEKEKENN